MEREWWEAMGFREKVRAVFEKIEVVKEFDRKDLKWKGLKE